MLREVLDGCVAFGTLALAGVTGWLAWTSKGAERESYRARVDALAHRVIVEGLDVSAKPLRERPPATGAFVYLEAGTPWDLENDGDVHIGCPARVVIRNEGLVSALVRFEGQDHVGLLGRGFRRLRVIDGKRPLGQQPDFLSVQNGFWQVLPPGTTAEGTVVWWRTAKEWSEAVVHPLAPSPFAKATLTFRDATNGAEDRCELTFGAHALWRDVALQGKRGNQGWRTTLRSTPPVSGQAPPPIALIGPLERRYPGEPTRRSPWSKRSIPFEDELAPNSLIYGLSRRPETLPTWVDESIEQSE